MFQKIFESQMNAALQRLSNKIQSNLTDEDWASPSPFNSVASRIDLDHHIKVETAQLTETFVKALQEDKQWDEASEVLKKDVQDRDSMGEFLLEELKDKWDSAFRKAKFTHEYMKNGAQ